MLVLVAFHVLAMQASFNDSVGVKKSLGFEYWQIANFDLDAEESPGAWFSTLILLLASVLFLNWPVSIELRLIRYICGGSCQAWGFA